MNKILCPQKASYTKQAVNLCNQKISFYRVFFYYIECMSTAFLVFITNIIG